MCFAACSKPIKPVSESLFTLEDVQCECSAVTEEEAKHLILIGDKKLQQLLTDRELCIKRGWLEVGEGE